MTQPILFTGRFKKEYEELGSLGMGGFGVVLKARHRTDDTVYAVKQVLIEEGDKLKEVLREVRSHAKLKHQNIVAYNTSWLEKAEEEDRKHNYAWNEDDELSSRSEDSSNTGGPGRYLFITMELGNETLEKWLREHPNKGDRDLEITKLWIKQLRDGLEYIHEREMFHRDLKPSNILMFRGPNRTVLKISDFGLVKASRNKDGAVIVRHTGDVGTELYMAPELIEGKRKYDKTVDIYSMGLIFIEMVFPMSWEDKETAFEKLQTGETPEFLKIRDRTSDDINVLKEILLGMTAKSPWNRLFAWYELLDNDIPGNKYKKPLFGRLKDEYEVLGTLGRGTFGVVFKASYNKTEYVVKKVHIEQWENWEEILREVRSHAAFRHENVLASEAWWLKKETGSSGFYLYIAMNFTNVTLEKFLEVNPNKQDRDLEDTKIWMKGLKDGLKYIHENNIIHRGLKPSNILMFHYLSKTVLKISDFGLVKTARDKDGAVRVRHTGGLGTKLYMAPELLNGEREYDKAVDIYSMGLIFIEMAFPMKQGDKERAFGMRRNGEEPEFLMSKDDDSDDTKFLKKTLLQMTERNPDERSTGGFRSIIFRYAISELKSLTL